MDVREVGAREDVISQGDRTGGVKLLLEGFACRYKTLEDGRTTGVVKTLYGRRRPVPELTSRNGQVRTAMERIAVNMPIQGTAADILKRAMIDVHHRAPSAPATRCRARPPCRGWAAR